ncbi:MAG: hypothetical protein EOP09_02125, partial [Proteobacteria bacterium]
MSWTKFSRRFRALIRGEEAAKGRPLTFREFVQIANPRYRWAWHHELIASVFERLISGELRHPKSGKAIRRVFVFVPPRHGKPIWEEELVLMGDGTTKPLKEVRVGDEVVTAKGRPRKVLAVHVQGELPCIRMTTATGRKVTTEPTHAFLTPGGWKKAGELSPGECLTVLQGPTIGNDVTPAEAFRLAGYFVGDGACGKVSTTINAKITALDTIEREDIVRCAEALGFEIGKPDKDAITLKGGVRDWLRETGLSGKGSREKRVPEFVKQGTPELIGHFLGAYFACDGSINRRTGARRDCCVELYSVSGDLLADVQDLLARIGVQSTIREKVATRGTNFLPGARYVSYRLSITSRDDVARFAGRVPMFHSKKATLDEWALPRQTFDSLYRPDEIVSIEDAGMLLCRCLTVKEDETFTAAGFVVHNSELISRLASAYLVYRHPSKWVAIASYGAGLAQTLSRAARMNYRTAGGELSPDMRAVRQWATPEGGGLWCCGVGGEATGK